MFKANTLAAGRLCALLAAAALALPLSASADEQSGMVVVRDAQTKQMRMATPQELRALQTTRQGASDSASRQALSAGVSARADGTLQKRLGGAHQVYSVMTRDADGKLGMQCVDGEHAAHAALSRPAPVAAHNKEHSHENR